MARQRRLRLPIDICLRAPLLARASLAQTFPVQRVFDKAYLIKNTSIVSVCRIVGVVAGLILDAVILAWFGIGSATDAFFAALAIPFLIDGTLSIQFTQVLVPLLASLRKECGPEGVWTFLSNLINIWLLAASVVACAAMAMSIYIIPLQVPGLNSTALGLAGHMNMLLAWLIPLSGLAAMLQGALFSLHRFWITSSTKAINNICIIGVVLLLYRSVGIYALAVGYLAGFASQCIALWFALRRCGFVYRWTCDWRDPRVKDTARLVLYPMAGQLLGEGRTLIENFLTSFFAPGVLSALRYASRIIYALSGILVGGVVTATAPMVAHYVAEKDSDGMKRSLRNGIQLLVFICLPVGACLAFTGGSLISLMFERGQFSKADVALTSSLMALMTPYIFFSRAISIIQTPFYAVKDTKTLVLGMVLSFILYVAVTPVLVNWLGVYGFPLATSAATGLGAVAMYALFRRSFGAMGWNQVGNFLLRIGVAIVVTSGGFLLGRQFVVQTGSGNLVNQLIAAGIPSCTGLFAFFLAVLSLFDVSAISPKLALLFRRKSSGDS